VSSLWFEKLKNIIKDFFSGFDGDDICMFIFLVIVGVVVIGLLVMLIVMSI